MPARPVLTPQRRLVLDLIAEYHFLTTEQFYELFANGQTLTDSRARAVRQTLLLMTRSGYLNRSRFVIDKSSDPFLRYSYCYSRGPAAAGYGPPGMSRGYAPVSVAHEIEITRFHMTLVRALADTSLKLYWVQHGLKRTVNPDALFAITDPSLPRFESTFYYFLEIEKSRQAHYRAGNSGLATKLRRYLEYRNSARCREEWRHFSDFRVIVILATTQRQTNLLRQLSRITGTSAIWTTTEATYREHILGRHFLAPCDYETESHSIALMH